MLWIMQSNTYVPRHSIGRIVVNSVYVCTYMKHEGKIFSVYVHLYDGKTCSVYMSLMDNM